MQSGYSSYFDAFPTASRFNLLLMEEYEYLFEEYAATMVVHGVGLPSELGSGDTAMRGRLRVCSRGLFFEPDDSRLHIMKFPLRTMVGKPQVLSSMATTPLSTALNGLVSREQFSPRDTVACQVTQVVLMKPGGAITPYLVRQCGQDAPVEKKEGGKGGGGAGAGKKGGGGLFGSSGGAAATTSSAAAAAAAAAAAPPAMGPFTPAPTRVSLLFILSHTPGAEVVPFLQQLWDIQVGCIDAASGRERGRLEPLVATRRVGPFNLSLLADYRERPLTRTDPAPTAERVFPLVSCPGRLAVTPTALYFEPVAVNNLSGSDPVQKWALRDITRVLRRPRLQRSVGLEVQLVEGAQGCGTLGGTDLAAAGLHMDHPSTRGVFFAFEHPRERDEVYEALVEALVASKRGGGEGEEEGEGGVRGDGASSSSSGSGSGSGSSASSSVGDPPPSHLAQLTRAWQSRALSNYDYLLALNSAAGRSRCDLTAYPVFPWVLADYSSDTLDLTSPATFRDLSKPMGALNPKRLASLRERYREMPTGGEGDDPPFLYGTHYSTPGYCLYFLARTMPEHILRLQSGRFDAPDRMFHDIAATYGGCTGLNSDFKELIPEFYEAGGASGDGAFTLMPDGLNLGVRASGKRLGDVGLPPWAYDASDFVGRMREALECDAVSGALHFWIDLVFGAKQRGEVALEADNLFYYLTYEGAVDVEGIVDPDERASKQSQIAEFGQTPRQLFRRGHPGRGDPPAPATGKGANGRLLLPAATGEEGDGGEGEGEGEEEEKEEKEGKQGAGEGKQVGQGGGEGGKSEKEASRPKQEGEGAHETISAMAVAVEGVVVGSSSEDPFSSLVNDTEAVSGRGEEDKGEGGGRSNSHSPTPPHLSNTPPPPPSLNTLPSSSASTIAAAAATAGAGGSLASLTWTQIPLALKPSPPHTSHVLCMASSALVGPSEIMTGGMDGAVSVLSLPSSLLSPQQYPTPPATTTATVKSSKRFPALPPSATTSSSITPPPPTSSAILYAALHGDDTALPLRACALDASSPTHPAFAFMGSLGGHLHYLPFGVAGGGGVVTLPAAAPSAILSLSTITIGGGGGGLGEATLVACGCSDGSIIVWQWCKDRGEFSKEPAIGMLAPPPPPRTATAGAGNTSSAPPPPPSSSSSSSSSSTSSALSKSSSTASATLAPPPTPLSPAVTSLAFSPPQPSPSSSSSSSSSSALLAVGDGLGGVAVLSLRITIAPPPASTSSSSGGSGSGGHRLDGGSGGIFHCEWECGGVRHVACDAGATGAASTAGGKSNSNVNGGPPFISSPQAKGEILLGSVSGITGCGWLTLPTSPSSSSTTGTTITNATRLVTCGCDGRVVIWSTQCQEGGRGSGGGGSFSSFPTPTPTTIIASGCVVRQGVFQGNTVVVCGNGGRVWLWDCSKLMGGGGGSGGVQYLTAKEAEGVELVAAINSTGAPASAAPAPASSSPPHFTSLSLLHPTTSSSTSPVFLMAGTREGGVALWRGV